MQSLIWCLVSELAHEQDGFCSETESESEGEGEASGA